MSDTAAMVAHMRAGMAARDAERLRDQEQLAAPSLAHLRREPCGCDQLCERAAIIEIDGKRSREDAERLATTEKRHDWLAFEDWHETFTLSLGPIQWGER